MSKREDIFQQKALFLEPHYVESLLTKRSERHLQMTYWVALVPPTQHMSLGQLTTKPLWIIRPSVRYRPVLKLCGSSSYWSKPLNFTRITLSKKIPQTKVSWKHNMKRNWKLKGCILNSTLIIKILQITLFFMDHLKLISIRCSNFFRRTDSFSIRHQPHTSGFPQLML